VRDFLAALWPEFEPSSELFTIWGFPSKESLHISIGSLASLDDDDLAELRTTNESGENLYFGLGARHPEVHPLSRGKRSDVTALPGLALDIDMDDGTPGVHKATSKAATLPLPKNADEAYSVIAHLPDPSIIVDSGYGWHVYWLFEEPVSLTTQAERKVADARSEQFQRAIIKRAHDKLGLHVDLTASIDRVFRLPGFNNHKIADSPRPVTVLHCEA
jgi:hypothetical protein